MPSNTNRGGYNDDDDPPPPPSSSTQQYGSLLPPQQDILGLNDMTTSGSHRRTSNLRGSMLYRASITSNLVGTDFLDDLEHDANVAAAAGVLSITPDNNWTRSERPSMSVASSRNSIAPVGGRPSGSERPSIRISNQSNMDVPMHQRASHHHNFDDAEFFDHHQHHPEMQHAADQAHLHKPVRANSILRPSVTKEEIYEELEEATGEARTLWDRISHAWTLFMFHGIQWDEDGIPFFTEDMEGSAFTAATSPSAWFRFLVFNPIYPEFTALQQSCWAVIIGVTMGVFTAWWQFFIEFCVEFMWKEIPEFLLRHNILTDLNGSFPLPYYIVLCTGICGCVLSYINVILPTTVPGQNEWIQDTHNQGVLDSSAFWHLFFMSTAGMASGMSLGPELPLVLLGGMYGSWLGILTKQSVLQARVLNLTAGSAIVSGFFGFPMAGGLFVLELPHRMGLQYFEALTPATVSSIVAVITNRMVNHNDVTGYYHYPFMTLSLPSRIFVSAIIYGAFGSLVGVLYGKGVTWLKTEFHGLFHHHETHPEPAAKEDHGNYHDGQMAEEGIPLVGDPKLKVNHKQSSSDFFACCRKKWELSIPHEPTRAGVVGAICGTLVGVTGLFLPHVLFWGEAQLQTLIDQGRTPLPIFGRPGEPTADLTAYGFCLVDPSNAQAVEAGFGLTCSALITFGKIWTTGISLGTGIIAGQFWGPLFTGCAAAQFFTALAKWSQANLGFGGWLAAHPCVAILCIMGSSHVVTFRTHSAIALILTLTISSFDSGGNQKEVVAGDYSAVFPLLVVAVYVSFILARDFVFYKAQRARGDILALPEVLCEPGKVGRPLVVQHTDDYDDDYPGEFADGTALDSQFLKQRPSNETIETSTNETITTSESDAKLSQNRHFRSPSHEGVQSADSDKAGHRRSLSVPEDSLRLTGTSDSVDRKSPSPRPPSPGGKNLVRVVTYGEVTDHQPSLLDQARARAANVDVQEMKHQHRRYPSLPKIFAPKETKN